MNGRSDCVKVGIYLHANSRASSQSQLACLQAVTQSVRIVKLFSLKVGERKIFIEVAKKLTKTHRGKKTGILSSQRSQAHEGGEKCSHKLRREKQQNRSLTKTGGMKNEAEFFKCVKGQKQSG